MSALDTVSAGGFGKPIEKMAKSASAAGDGGAGGDLARLRAIDHIEAEHSAALVPGN